VRLSSDGEEKVDRTESARDEMLPSVDKVNIGFLRRTVALYKAEGWVSQEAIGRSSDLAMQLSTSIMLFACC